MEKKCSAVIIGVGPEQDLGASLAKFLPEKFARFRRRRSEDKLHKMQIKLDKSGSATPVIADGNVWARCGAFIQIAQLDGYSIDIAATM